MAFWKAHDQTVRTKDWQMGGKVQDPRSCQFAAVRFIIMSSDLPHPIHDRRLLRWHFCRWTLFSQIWYSGDL